MAAVECARALVLGTIIEFFNGLVEMQVAPSGGLSILAALVSPTLFVAGAAAVAAPILIHLLARRRFKRIRWAAMEFLIHAERRNRRRIRMEEWILLALRCLAILAIALIVSRPFIRSGSFVSSLGGSRQTERVFVLDDSFSMAYRSQDGSTSFARAKLGIRRILESVRRESPDDTITILRMSNVAQQMGSSQAGRPGLFSPVESGTYLDDAQTQEVLARLEALEPSNRSIEVGSVVQGVAGYLEESPAIVGAVVYFLSDFQQHNWVPVQSRSQYGSRAPQRDSVRRPSGSGRPEVAGLFDPLATWAGEDRALRIVLVNVGDPNAANVAVTGLDISSGQLVAGTKANVRVTVANYAQQATKNIELNVSLGSLSQTSKVLAEIAAGQETSVEVAVEFLQAGSVSLRVDLALSESNSGSDSWNDPLPLDNTRYATTTVSDAIRVLIVNGEPSPDILGDEVGFLATALRPEGEVFSGNEYVIVDEVELESAELAGFHAVILANVYRIGEPVIEALERFVKSGGGLLVFVGDQVDPDLYNTALYRDGDGLLPASIIEVATTPNQVHLVISDRLHPAMRRLAHEGDPLGIGRIAFFSYMRCQPFEVEAGMEQPAVSADLGAPSSAHSNEAPARVIARFDDADESPAIIERPFGQGRVVLVTTTADKEWNLWPDHPTYLPMIHELVHHVARRSDGAGEHRIGSPIELPLDPAVFEADAVVRTPTFPVEREVGLTAAPPSEGSGLVLKWEHTEEPGVYRFVLNRRDGGQEIHRVAVNPDSRESDLSMCGADEIRRVAGDVPFDYMQGIDALGADNGEGRTELWRMFLVLALVVLMGEQTLAWWWGVRR